MHSMIASQKPYPLYADMSLRPASFSGAARRKISCRSFAVPADGAVSMKKNVLSPSLGKSLLLVGCSAFQYPEKGVIFAEFLCVLALHWE